MVQSGDGTVAGVLHGMLSVEREEILIPTLAKRGWSWEAS